MKKTAKNPAGILASAAGEWRGQGALRRALRRKTPLLRAADRADPGVKTENLKKKSRKMKNIFTFEKGP